MPVRILVTLVCQIAIAMDLTAAHTSHTLCETGGNFTNNSTYGRNRDLILASLPSNVSRNGGFFSGSVGQEPDKVYALGLCRGDSSPEDCSNNIGSATRDILAKCHDQKEAISWGLQGNPPCIVRYTNRSIFGILELDPTETTCDQNYIYSNLTRFDEVWENLSNSLVRKASMGSSNLKFATGETDFNSLDRIYSLMQCTPDLSQSDCASCLSVSVDDYRRRCHGRRGGYVHKPNCFVRWDLHPFYSVDAPPLSPPPPPPHSNDTSTKKEDGGISSRTVVIIVVPIVIFAVVGMLAAVVLLKRRKKTKHDDQDDKSLEKSLQFDFNAIRVATENFSDTNMLGQGGFGAVYKGKLEDGQEIAVKRLSENSAQGEQEFKNEVMLLAKLQHRNLVRFLGFSLDQKERILIYEFLPNSSLNHFIFDPIKRLLLTWEQRYKIIKGIAKGLLYLHQDSQYRIIHRDLKAANILLDEEMNLKISDFGMAKLFPVDQTQADTSRIVGTFGYMAPEYAGHGQYSVKSDVYSFGVLLLEIISGRKINSFTEEKMGGSLLTDAWKNWQNGTVMKLIDSNMREGSSSETLRCIRLGLLCVQENIPHRPTMASVVLMLSRHSTSIPMPTRPAFLLDSITESETKSEASLSDQSKSKVVVSVNEASFSELCPR